MRRNMLVIITRARRAWTIRANWLSCSYVHRQLIPGLRTRHSKCAGAKVRDKGGDNEVATSGRLESLSATNGCDWSTEVGDVRRCQSMQSLVCQQTQLELDALRGGSPATRAWYDPASWRRQLIVPLSYITMLYNHRLRRESFYPHSELTYYYRCWSLLTKAQCYTHPQGWVHHLRYTLPMQRCIPRWSLTPGLPDIQCLHRPTVTTRTEHHYMYNECNYQISHVFSTRYVILVVFLTSFFTQTLNSRALK